MRKFTVTMVLLCLNLFDLNSQNTSKGIAIASNSKKTLPKPFIGIKKGNYNKVSNFNGEFTLHRLAKGKQTINISPRKQLTDSIVDLDSIIVRKNPTKEIDLSVITLADNELGDETNTADNIAGLLQATKDTYLRSAAYDWSGSFYSIKGLYSEYAKVLINGIEMNKDFNGRPQWNNWGGLNSALKNQVFSNGLSPSNYSFGSILGTTNIHTRASSYQKGIHISYASSNKSYTHRLMAKYSSGILKNGWAFTVAASKRFANEGFIDGTSYNAQSLFATIEKLINKKHSLNFTAIQAKTNRGKSAANTQAVTAIKGTTYNPYWGYQNGKIRNARIKRVNEPILMLHHFWKLNDKTRLNTGIAYQFGEIGNSRIDFKEGNNPNPTYYRKLPNYFLNNKYKTDHANAYKAFTNFKSDGQLNWHDLYIANENTNNNALYVLYEDRNDDKLITATTNLNSKLNEHITLSGNLEYRKLHSENFASVLDLFGANGYLDIHKFGDIGNDNRQNNLLHPNRIVKKHDRFKYNYIVRSENYGGFAQLQFTYNKIDFYMAAAAKNTKHQREGLYKNGLYPGSLINSTAPNSLGKSKKLNFFGYSGKAGFTYKISGRHLINFNSAYFNNAPTLKNSFVNSRFNNLTVADVSNLTNKKSLSFDASYIARTPFITAKVSGYYTSIKDATNIAFYYTDATKLFVQEVTTGINNLHFGTEIGIETQILPSFKLKTAANIGQYTYSNNPTVVLATEINTTSNNIGFNDKGIKDYGKANLKNYRVGSGPQTAYSFGFEYNDADYWFLGATLNYLDNNFVSPSIIRRTSSFVTDDGLFFPDYNPATAKKLLKQEKFEAYTTLNVVGGKTWRISKGKYLGLFISLTNLLGKKYKTGGYEQGRTTNYRLLNKDQSNGTPNFGNKYWYGSGASYFLHINYRF